MSTLHKDTTPLLVADAGPAVFRITAPPAKLSISVAGTLKSWDGTTWDTGVAMTESQTIVAPGYYQLTLDEAGNASVQELASKVT